MKRFSGIKITRALLKNNIVLEDNSSRLIKNDSSKIINNVQYEYDSRVCICVVLDGFTDKMLDNLVKLRGYFKAAFIVFSVFNCSQSEIEKISVIKHSVVFNSNSKDITLCRNEYLNFFTDNANLFDYMLVIDSLTLHTEFTSELFSCFKPDKVSKWDVIFANQFYRYYDIDNLVREETLEFHKEKDESIKKELKMKLQTHIPADSDMINVKSAFGGLAIYHKAVIQTNNSYKNDEHVSFNLKVSELTTKMFIDPSMQIKTLPGYAYLYV
jgi:hypothetical protein